MLGCRRWPSGSTWCSAATKISTSCRDRRRLRQSRARTVAPNLLSMSVRRRHSLPTRRIPCEMAMRRRSRCVHGGWRLRLFSYRASVPHWHVSNPSQRHCNGSQPAVIRGTIAVFPYHYTSHISSYDTPGATRTARRGRSFGFSSFVVFRSVQAVVLQC